MQELWAALAGEFSDFPDLKQAVSLGFRLALAVVLAGLLGYERERRDAPAGLRTHMMVGLGAALFVLVPQQTGVVAADMTRVLQGVVAGIGFLGAGAILKSGDRGEVSGLTTAASIWTTAAIGVAAGLGKAFTAIAATGLALLILAAVLQFEKRIK
ncbi:MAG: MgtC/SapB family protein [Pseudomonadota bacterium]